MFFQSWVLSGKSRGTGKIERVEIDLIEIDLIEAKSCLEVGNARAGGPQDRLWVAQRRLRAGRARRRVVLAATREPGVQAGRNPVTTEPADMTVAEQKAGATAMPSQG